MKKLTATFSIILLIISGCGKGKQTDDQASGFITVDVTVTYPRKELILQDFMDAEYIPLETAEDFLCQGLVQSVGEDIIIVRNRINDGNIFVFDKKGKGLKKINRKGNGGEEYTFILEIVLDEDNGEIFVNDHMLRKILVYDLDGKFKRSFKHKEGAMYNGIYNFDQENLICNDSYHSEKGTTNEQAIIVISKHDGSISEEIQIPFEAKKSTWVIVNDVENNMVHSSSPRNHFPVIPFNGTWILTEPSSDTIYTYMANHNMIPFIVRTPSIQSMSTEVFLFPGTLTERYCFLQAVKKEYDFTNQKGYPNTNLVYDNQEKSIFEYVVYNGDYSEKSPMNMTSKFISDKIAYWQILEANSLVEAYEKGELKGKLKEIAAKLDEESNPVLMFAKYKK